MEWWLGCKGNNGGRSSGIDSSGSCSHDDNSGDCGYDGCDGDNDSGDNEGGGSYHYDDGGTGSDGVRLVFVVLSGGAHFTLQEIK